MKTVEDICKYIGSVVGPEPYCIETGSTFAITPENLIHTTTNNIAKYICLPNNGVLVSLDINKERQSIARTVCPQEAKVVFMTGDSVKSMKDLAKTEPVVDVLCLDSAEDADHMVNEYMAIKDCLCNNGHFVMVDDIHNPGSVKYKKLVPMLKDLGYSCAEVPTPVGMLLAAHEYDLNVN